MSCSSTRAIVCFLPAVNIGPYASSWNSKMAIASIAVGEGSMFQTLGSPSPQMSDPALQDGICGQADRILAALRFSGTVDLPVKRAALEQDCAASRWPGHGRP